MNSLWSYYFAKGDHRKQYIIGVESVVSKDIPSGVLAAKNPCAVKN